MKADKLMLDKRGRALHNSKTFSPSESSGGAMRRSQSKAEGMSESTRRTSNTSGMLNQQEEFYFFKMITNFE